MKQLLLLFAGIAILLSSCVNTKKLNNHWIYKNQKIYSNYDKVSNGDSMPVSCIKTYNIKEGFAAKITDENGEITISNFDTLMVERINDTVVKSADGSKTNYYYPSKLTFRDTLTFRKSFLKDKPSFKYLEISPVLQASTIPFKFRPKQDSINSNVSTSGNLGFVYGLKFTNHNYKNIYNSKGKRYNTHKTSYSITPGFFVGPTTVDLTANNTNNYVNDDITVLGINSGFLLVFGVNKFNIGGAIGFDYAFGKDGEKWIYNGEPWYGFVLSLDFIK